MRISSIQPGIFPVVALLVAATATGCSRQQETPPATTAAAPPAADASIPATSSPYEALPATVRSAMDKPFTGDLDEMVERHAIRVAVTFNRTHYFIDMGQERGMTYDALKEFEKDLNADCFRNAIETARRQQSRAWELRATTSLARLWRRRGRREEARDALAAVYGTYTEGFTTPDLVEAKVLLERLAEPA